MKKIKNPEKIDTENPEFQQVWKLINYTRQSVFLTGKAGTGKSTFLRYITTNTKKKHIVLAPTGVAAVNAGGVTIHSFFQLPLKPIVPDDPDFAISRLRERMKYSRKKKNLIKNLELIIIDEISMVRADTIDFIDKLLRYFSGNHREPFGGKQLLLVGDIFQLEPVVTSDSKDVLSRYYSNLFFFGATAFTNIGIVPIELQKNYRQTDNEFVSILDRIRIGQPTLDDFRVLNSRTSTQKTETSTSNNFVMTLASQRDMVDSINDAHLAKIKLPEVVYKGEIEGNFPETATPTPILLTIKVGTQVVFIRNDIEKRWYNGTLGKVTFATENRLEVELEDGTVHTVSKERWSNIKYEYDERTHRVDEIELGAFIQYPIRPAWALTIHKSQGLTFSNVIIDLGRGAFSAGQTYVALSRCRSLEGLSLRSNISQRDIFVNPLVARFSSQFNNPALIEKALMKAEADDSLVKAAQLWDEDKIFDAVDLFCRSNSIRPINWNDKAVVRLIKQKLSIISEMKNEIKSLKATISKQKEQLEKISKEYISLGEMGVDNDYGELSAAIANFNKALELDPNSIDALQGKATALTQSGETEAAIEIYRKITSLNPNDAEVLFELGELYYLTGEIHDSLDTLLKANALDSQNPNILLLMAKIYDQIGDESEAKRLRKAAAKYAKKRK